MADHLTHPLRQDTSLTTPAALMLDVRLTPLERNGWQVLCMLRAANGLSTLTNMSQLRRYLTTTPLGQCAGYETAWRALTVLRLTGWISLVGRNRDPMTGQVLSELYQVHDSALSFQQACALDASLLALLQTALAHENNQVTRVALHIRDMLGQAAQTIPVDAQRPHDDDDPPSPPPLLVDAHAAEPSVCSGTTGLPQTASDCRTTPVKPSTYKYLYKEKRTYRAHAHESADEPPCMALPPCLSSAKAGQQKDVRAALHWLPPERRQDVLDELQARSQGGTVRNVVAYFFALVKRVFAGEFRLWAGRKTNPAAGQQQPVVSRPVAATPRPEKPQEPHHRPASPETVRAHLAHLREVLKMPKNAGALAEQAMRARGWRPHPA